MVLIILSAEFLVTIDGFSWASKLLDTRNAYAGISDYFSGDPKSAWDKLSGDDQKKILNKLKQELPTKLGEGKAQEYSQFVGEHIETLSKYAGEISAGEYKSAMNALADYSARQMAAKLSEKIKGKLPKDSIALKVYEKIEANSEAAKKVGQAVLDPRKSWQAVGELAWNETKEILKSEAQDYSKELVKKTINSVFGDGKLAGYNPGEIYLMIIEGEMAIINAYSKYFRQSGQNQLYRMYRESRNSSGGNRHTADVITRNQYNTLGSMGSGQLQTAFAAFAELGISLNQILELFDKFYNSPNGKENNDFYSWLKEKAKEDARQAEDEKKKIIEALNEEGGIARNQIGQAFQEAQKLLQQLIEEHLSEEEKKKRDEAIDSAAKPLAMLERAVGYIQQACRDYDSAKISAQEASDAIKKINNDLDRLNELISIADKSNDIQDEAVELNNAWQNIQDLIEKINSYYQELSSAVDDCYAQNIKDAKDKEAAKKLLDKAIEAGKRAEKAYENAKPLADRLKSEGNRFTSDANEYYKKYGGNAVIKIQQAIAAIKEIINRVGEGEQKIADFNSAKASMAEAIEKTKLLDLIEEKKKEIEGILAPHNPDPEGKMADIRNKIRASLERVDCITAKQSHWSDFTRKKAPSLTAGSEAKIKDAENAIKKTGALGELPVFTDAITELSRQAKRGDEIESMKFAYVLCVADALEAYANFKEKADQDLSALDKEIDKVEAICQQAQQDYDNALKSADAALQASGKIDALAKQIEAGLKQIEGDLAACRNAPTERSAAALAYSEGARWAGRSRQGFNGALSKATACTSKESMAEVDELVSASEAVAFGAARKFQQGEQHRKNMDDIIARAKQAKDKAAQLARQASSVAAEVAVVNGHISTANGFRSAADDGFTACDGGKSDLLGRLDTLVAKSGGTRLGAYCRLEKPYKRAGPGFAAHIFGV